MGERVFNIRNIQTDVSRPDCITVLHCKDQGKEIILFGLSDCELGHYGLLELAQDPDFALSNEEYILSENAQVLGGVLLDYKNLNKVRDSLAFGPMDEEALLQFVDRIEERRLIQARRKNL